MLEIEDLSDSKKAALSKHLSTNIKLIFFDIDGTLVDSSVLVPKDVIEQIRRLQQCGIKMAIASGRPYFAAQYFTNELSLDGAGLFCTGAMLYEPKQKKLFGKHILTKPELKQLIELTRGLELHCELYTEHDYYIEHESLYSDYHAGYLGQAASVWSFDTLLASDKEIIKALIAYEGTVGHEKYRQIQAALPNLHFAHGHGADRPEIYFTSIVSDRVNKPQAFRQLCEAHGVSSSQVL